MILSRHHILALLLVASPALLGATARKQPTRPAPAEDRSAYKGAIVLNADTGDVLFQDRAEYKGPPASVTKLMTFLLVHDRLKRGDVTLQTPVVVTAEAAKIAGSQVYLAEKEVFAVEDLLYALMIASANDAATALAIHIAGSRNAFVGLMNARAQELGMNDTTFHSPHGLPPSKGDEPDITSPRDLGKLALHLLKTTNVLTYASVKQRTFRPGPRHIDMVNHNHLLGKIAGVDGLKTGYTRGAGFCLAATAQRNGRRVLVVTMGSPDSKTRDMKIAELIERGFAALPPRSAVPVIPGAAETPIQPAPKAKPSPPPEPPIKFTVPKR